MDNKDQNNSILNIQTSMSTTFQDLEKEISDRAANEFPTVIARMLDMYEERLKRIIAMNKYGNEELEEIRSLYVSIKLRLHRVLRRSNYMFDRANDLMLTNRISELEIQTNNARRKFYEFKRSIDPHSSECKCRGCRFLGKMQRNSKGSVS